jgi:two-component system phosphate regulon sensor histidine kinase PhoR
MLTQLAVVAVVIALFGLYLVLDLQRRMQALLDVQLEQALGAAVAVLSSVPEGDPHALEMLDVTGDAMDVRITVINEGGEVLLDTAFEGDEHEMQNHAARPEVVEAFSRGVGHDLRSSSTLGARYIYRAMRLERTGGTWIVRAALPTQSVDSQFAKARLALAVASAAALLIGAVLAWLVSMQVTRPIEVLTRTARSMAEGRFETEVPRMNTLEFRRLGLSLDQLRTQLAERLRQVEEESTLLFTIVEAMNEGLVVVDATGRVFLINPVALQMLGCDDTWTTDSAEGRMLVEVTRNPRLIDQVEHVIRTASMHRDEIESRRGTLRHLGVSIAPLSEDGAVRGAVVALYDLTQVRQLERMRQDFVANVSHELRTPIAAIRGWAETLTSGIVELEPLVEEQLLTILHHGERLSALVSDLLTLARVEALGIEGAFVEVDLAGLIDEVLMALDEAIAEREMKVEVHLPTGLGAIRSEPRAIEYVLRNLVENAVKYTPAGGRVDVTVEYGRDDELLLRVSDNGPGIESQHLPRIFERFYRVDKGRSRDVGGTGLGLSIVKHFATALGGHVKVESEVGTGSAFTLHLPARAWKGEAQ